MIVKRFVSFDEKDDELYGYVVSKYPYEIYIRYDLKGTDYIETLIHESVHWIIFRVFKSGSRISIRLHCWFDMIDAFINTLDVKMIKKYYKYYASI